MIHELRVYEIFETTKEAFHARFRDHAARLMRAQGFEIVGLWEAQGEGRLEFIYLLAWPDLATRDAKWAAFMGDEEWQAIKRETAAQHGDLVGSVESRVLTPTAYSPL